MHVFSDVNRAREAPCGKNIANKVFLSKNSSVRILHWPSESEVAGRWKHFTFVYLIPTLDSKEEFCATFYWFSGKIPFSISKSNDDFSTFSSLAYNSQADNCHPRSLSANRRAREQFDWWSFDFPTKLGDPQRLLIVHLPVCFSIESFDLKPGV